MKVGAKALELRIVCQCGARKAPEFRTLVWQFKRVSGSSGLKVQAAIAC